MSRHDERERIRQRLGALTARVGASRTAGVGLPDPTGAVLAVGASIRRSDPPPPARATEAQRVHRPAGGESLLSVRRSAATGAPRADGPARTDDRSLSRRPRSDSPLSVATTRELDELVRAAPDYRAPRDGGDDSTRWWRADGPRPDPASSAEESEEFAGGTRAPSPQQGGGRAAPESDSGSWDLDELPGASDVVGDRSGEVTGAPRPDVLRSGTGLRDVGASAGPESGGVRGAWAPIGVESSAVAVDHEGDGEVRSPRWLDGPEPGPGWRERLVPARFRGTRVDPGRRGVVTLVVVGLIAMAVAMVVVLRERPVAHPVPPVPAVRTTTPPAVARGVAAQPGETSAPAAPGALPAAVPGTDGAAGELVVSVVGLVHKIGLVRLPAGSRVADAVAAAGGAREGADLTGLNLAQRLTDGDQVLVAPASPSPGPPQLGSATIGATGRASSTAKPDSGAISPNSRVNLNTATESDLDALPGVGPVTARAIITWRTANGRFTDLEQLGEIDGIGPTRLARLRNLVTV